MIWKSGFTNHHNHKAILLPKVIVNSWEWQKQHLPRSSSRRKIQIRSPATLLMLLTMSFHWNCRFLCGVMMNRYVIYPFIYCSSFVLEWLEVSTKQRPKETSMRKLFHFSVKLSLVTPLFPSLTSFAHENKIKAIHDELLSCSYRHRLPQLRSRYWVGSVFARYSIESFKRLIGHYPTWFYCVFGAGR